MKSTGQARRQRRERILKKTVNESQSKSHTLAKGFQVKQKSLYLQEFRFGSSYSLSSTTLQLLLYTLQKVA